MVECRHQATPPIRLIVIAMSTENSLSRIDTPMPAYKPAAPVLKLVPKQDEHDMVPTTPQYGGTVIPVTYSVTSSQPVQTAPGVEPAMPSEEPNLDDDDLAPNLFPESMDFPHTSPCTVGEQELGLAKPFDSVPQSSEPASEIVWAPDFELVPMEAKQAVQERIIDSNAVEVVKAEPTGPVVIAQAAAAPIDEAVEADAEQPSRRFGTKRLKIAAAVSVALAAVAQIGRASCRERVLRLV